MLDVERRALQLSNRFYNHGLDRARIRDLSGAVEMLKRSLQMNKKNIQARNLLGLVYFETGEAVSALSEWVISKNLQAEDNIASDYIAKVQENPTKLAVINQSIKNYNAALESCRKGDEDVAAISLKRIISQNPKFIKAYHLLALIYIKMEKYNRARRLLKKAQKIDQTNPTTLRYMKEIDDQIGAQPDRSRRRENDETTEQRMQVVNFHQRSPMIGFANIIVGLAIGVLAAWFLIAPSVRQSAGNDANDKIAEYSKTMASQQDQITKLQAQVDESNSTVESANQQIEEAKQASEAYENLLKGYRAYEEEEYSSAAESFESINTDLLSADAKVIYDDVYDNISTVMFRRYRSDGISDYENGDYAEAIELLEKAKAINDDNYGVLDYLALSYRANNDTQKAIDQFQEIVDKYPNTRRAASAQNYIDELKESQENSGDTDNSDNNSDTDNSDDSDNNSDTDNSDDSDNDSDTDNSDDTDNE